MPFNKAIKALENLLKTRKKQNRNFGLALREPFYYSFPSFILLVWFSFLYLGLLVDYKVFYLRSVGDIMK